MIVLCKRGLKSGANRSKFSCAATDAAATAEETEARTGAKLESRYTSTALLHQPLAKYSFGNFVFDLVT